VLESGNDPQTYAESILKVCKFYLHSPLACAAGVSGADLNKRMEKIMENKSAARLSVAKKALLGFTAAVATAAPVLVGFATATRADDTTPQQIKANLAEQALPRREIAIDPAGFDKFAGYYRMTPNVIFVISHSGNHYFEGSIGQTPVEMYPESDSKFFLKGYKLPAQFSFTVDAQGRATELVLHQAGEEQHAARIDNAIGNAAEVELAHRIAANLPSPGTADALRRQIEGLMSGTPDYAIMVPTLAAGTREMLGDLHSRVSKWGAVKSVTFTGVGKDGMDDYLVVCENARSRWGIAPLTKDGRIGSIGFDEVR